MPGDEEIKNGIPIKKFICGYTHEIQTFDCNDQCLCHKCKNKKSRYVKYKGGVLGGCPLPYNGDFPDEIEKNWLLKEKATTKIPVKI
jgi:hypothetical protein